MPLASEFSEAEAADWVRSKDAQWDRHGYGPWAVLIAGAFAGWGGFQCERGDPDFALVLSPDRWGSGAEVARTALTRGFESFGFDAVYVALPLSRRPLPALARLGFVQAGAIFHDGVEFRRYRLTRDAWIASRLRAPAT